MSVPSFDDSLALIPRSGESLGALVDDSWSIGSKPNGGIIAALALQAMTTAVDDQMSPRTLTVHFLRPASFGELELHVTTLRLGRGMATTSVSLAQSGRRIAVGLAAFGGPRPGTDRGDLSPPTVPPPECCRPASERFAGPLGPWLHNHYDARWALGPLPFSGGRQAVFGGWIRTRSPRPTDAVLLAAVADAFPPAIYGTMTAPTPAPTVELTVHFWDTVGRRDGEWLLVRGSAPLERDGYYVETDRVWNEDGRLLAEARQLGAVALTGRPGALLP